MKGELRSVLLLPPWEVLWRQRSLIGQMARREITARYRGSALGLLWSLLTPLLLLLVYTFVFGDVFKSRWGTADGGRADFALMLFVGLIFHGMLAEVLARAPRLIIEQPNFVKKVVFPLEILAWNTVLAILFQALVSTAVLLVALVAVRGGLPPSALCLPLIFLAFLPVLLGVAWLFSAIGTYLRDLHQVTALLSTVLMFLAPVFYPVSALPARLGPFLLLNPLTFVIEQARGVLIAGVWPQAGGLALYGICALLFAGLSFWWFQRVRVGFADVL